jgi:hypothetical protein
MEEFLADNKTQRCQAIVKKTKAQCNNGAQKGFMVCGPHMGQAPATPVWLHSEELDILAQETGCTDDVPVEATPVPKGWLSYKLTCVQCGHVFELSFDSVERAMSTKAAFKAANGICKACR